MSVILNKDQLNELVEYYLKQDAFAFDVETMGEQRVLTPVNQVVWISLATYGRVDSIPMGHPNGDFIELVRPLTGQGQKRLDTGLVVRPSDYSRDDRKATKVFTEPPAQLFPDEVFEALRPLLFSDKLKIGHNLIFDLTSIAKYCNNEVAPGPYFDTMLASFLYDNRNKGKCSLDDCVERELGYHMVKGVGKDISVHTFDDVATYAELDAKYTWLLWGKLKEKVEEANVVKVMNLEMEVLRVLCDMKLAGAPIDTEALAQLKVDLERDIDELRTKIYQEANQKFNINSVPEKQFILYAPKSEGGRGLKTKVLTTKGKNKSMNNEELTYLDYSTSEEALKELVHDPLGKLLSAYSDLNKLLTTYIIPYLGDEEKTSLLISGRIHCDFLQNGAETGRFSSKNPNLQNIPNPEKSEIGKKIRNLFIAPEGYKLVVADYAQIEPRLIASFSQDPTMLEAFNTGKDIYTAIASKVGKDRSAGKVLNLSMSYGVGPDKVAKTLGIKLAEAKELLDNFAKEFKEINNYRSKVIASTRKNGYVTTICDRRRYLPDINSDIREKRSSAERQAFNTKIQGSAADIMKLAMCGAYRKIPQGSKLLLTVHDELVTLAPNHLAEETAEAIRDAMENVMKGVKTIRVPLIADIKIVDKWGDGKK